MKAKAGIFLMAASVALLAAATEANAAKLNFDGVSTTASFASIPNGYGGFSWVNMSVINRESAPGSGYYNGTVSGSYAAFNDYGDSASFYSDYGENFNFVGAYLTAAWNTGLNIKIRGYDSAVLRYKETVVVDPDAPTWFDFNFNDIDRLVFDSFGGLENGQPSDFTQFAMDDFTYVIPEPSSAILIGIISGCGLFVRRRFPSL